MYVYIGFSSVSSTQTDLFGVPRNVYFSPKKILVRSLYVHHQNNALPISESNIHKNMPVIYIYAVLELDSNQKYFSYTLVDRLLDLFIRSIAHYN